MQLRRRTMSCTLTKLYDNVFMMPYLKFCLLRGICFIRLDSEHFSLACCAMIGMHIHVNALNSLFFCG